jgi:hypothetical protein
LTQSSEGRTEGFDFFRRLAEQTTNLPSGITSKARGNAEILPPTTRDVFRPAAVRAELDVRGLQVPMDDPLLVRGPSTSSSAPSDSSSDGTRLRSAREFSAPQTSSGWSQLSR